MASDPPAVPDPFAEFDGQPTFARPMPGGWPGVRASGVAGQLDAAVERPAAGRPRPEPVARTRQPSDGDGAAVAPDAPGRGSGGAARVAGAGHPRLRHVRPAARHRARAHHGRALRAVHDDRRGGGRHPLGWRRPVGPAQPAGRVLQRVLRRREGLPADGQAGREARHQPRPARAHLRCAGARLRGPLPRHRRRPGAARGDSREAGADHPPAARRLSAGIGVELAGPAGWQTAGRCPGCLWPSRHAPRC